MKLIISNYNGINTANVFMTQDEETNPHIEDQISNLKEKYKEIAIFINGSSPGRLIIHQILQIKPPEDTSNDF